MDGKLVRTYREQDDNTIALLATGDVFQIRLTGNPTTGYRWHLINWDHSILQRMRDEFQTPGTLSPGTGGEHVWEFVVRAPGQCLLQLAYRRRWGATIPTKSFSLHISAT
ncbi:hypothetical protein KSF_007520 [Reticulibacter mediterranei]|uniref:Proteinase inhibitor I42 chagasin domain-containing protein n=1 Tax=Reticulibacter mediterranei TaxID=2778369 RepID=A0A8J3I8B4_9CHLR|nr:protease inhibitor I42 family protein [Reticulibacter mediterranei]GHO90704.1 hypothetical protein KSF_007520 [Reticulibacter mediterranei]